MDPILNPFSPGAGTPPPEFAGRSELLTQSEVLFARVAHGRSAKSILLTGLRGVGKTVLLNKMEQQALDANYKVILIEAIENTNLRQLLAPHFKKLLLELDRVKGAGDKVKIGIHALRNFIGNIKLSYGDIGIDLEPFPGIADSGDLETDVTDLIIALAQAAQERHTQIALLIDEIQYFSEKELSALIVAMHKIQQKQLPLVLVGAGLPILPRLAGESKSYAERLFDFPQIGQLSEKESEEALQSPVKQAGIIFSQEAIKSIYSYTQGYPYFLQEWGYQAWTKAISSPFTLALIEEVTPIVIRRLDENFFKVRLDRLTPSETRFLRAMAEWQTDDIKIKDIAQLLEVTVHTLSPTRSKLVKKGMIFSPSHGNLSFTVPLFGDFMLRHIPNLKDC